jgi:hypothetical protein
MSFSYEIELIRPVKAYLEEKGFAVFHEVRIGFCRADLVGISKETVIAVELKLANWKKALVQARNYQLAAEFVFLAFPDRKIDLVVKKTMDQLKKEGIGLLSVDEKDKQVCVQVEAKKSTRMFGCLQLEELQKKRKREERRRILRFF